MSSAIPEGARCGRHPEVGATALCARCGDFLCASCAIAIDGASYCERCEDRAGEAFPWERRGELGIARALVATTVGVLVRTRATFAPGFRDRSVLPALLYAILIVTPISWITTSVELVWPGEPAVAPDPALAWLDSPEAQLAYALGVPVHLLLSVAMFALAWSLGLAVSGAPRPPLSHVARAIAYVHGATAPLSLVSLLPDLVATRLWPVVGFATIVLQALAIRAMTRASGWRTAAAALVTVSTFAVLAFLAGMALGALAVL